MGRKINSVNNQAPFPFVPDLDDNRKDPKPFVVWMTCATSTENRKKDEAQLVFSLRAKGNSGAKATARQVSSRRDELIADHVHKIEEYSVQDLSGKVHTPTTGAELVIAYQNASSTEVELVMSCLEEAINDASIASEGMLKNSDASPPSS
ncbi:MAG: hypothetical protein JKY94_16775 [Rhodobacteraceae bacterium]|nr:hypothetical protein [Paracoccaceae bacterium]